MTDPAQLAEWFATSRGRLRGIAYRMLGSLSEADDALQETWLRASQAGPETIGNPDGWLTTVLARVCLNMLRSRRSRREDPLGAHLPDPLVGPIPTDPEQEAILAESIGLALLVVVQTLAPAERLAFVLHDVFGIPFDTIAAILARSPAATRQLASRARRRVRGVAGVPDADLDSQRRVVDAFFAAARRGDLEALMTVLDPDVVLRADVGPTPASRVVRGASEVVRFARAPSDTVVLPALVNGAVGAVVLRHGSIYSVMGFTVRGGRIVEIDTLGDRARLRLLDLTTVTAAPPPPTTGRDA